MFGFLLRKISWRHLSKDDQEELMLFKDEKKMRFISEILILLFALFPICALFASLIVVEHTLDNVTCIVILMLSYIIFLIWFTKRFYEQIEKFVELICASMYSSRYALKGNAISKQDFDIIRKEKDWLYDEIVEQRVIGFCYHVCFEILQSLKKGKMLYVAIRYMDNSKENEEGNAHTMHVLYVNNGWCFDTFTQRQYPLEKVVQGLKAKAYKFFEYKDIEGKSYEEFREEHAPALQKWCEENDCFTEFGKD